MPAPLRLCALACLAMVGLAGCASEGPARLMNIGSGASTPDEFAILPSRGLELPTDLAALPQPGGSDRAATDARGAAIVALGGRPGAGTRDPALTAIARDADPRIRDTLAAEDAAFRTAFSPRPLERAFGTNVYFRAYRPMSLDAQAELRRWRAAGVRTPAAPPAAN